jgi:hypothetical protein
MRDQPLDDGNRRSDDLLTPQLAHQRRGDRYGIGIPERHRRQLCEQLAPVFGGKHTKPESPPQCAQLLATRLVARGVIGESIRSNAQLAGNKGESRLRNGLARAQQAPRVTKGTELQREAKLVRIAATALYRGEIAIIQGPMSDQFGFGNRQYQQLFDLLAGNGSASRHGGSSQIDLTLFGAF